MNKHVNLGISLFSVFIVSGTLFMFEVILTRLFSTVLTYHFVFIVASVAILGLGLGAVRAHRKIESLTDANPEQIIKLGTRFLVYLGLSIPLVTLLIYKVPFLPFLLVGYAVLAVIPFVLGGIFLACPFRVFGKYSYLLYFGDLVGAGLSAYGVVRLLNTVNLIRVTLYLGWAVSLASLLLNFIANGTRLRFGKQAWIAMGGFVLIAGLSLTNIPEGLARDFTAYKGIPKMIGLLKLDGMKPVIKYSSWDAFARTDVLATNNPHGKIVLIDGGAAAPMVHFNGDLSTARQMEKDVGYLAFVPKKANRVLVIGSGGGKDILLARLSGGKHITAVEINPGSVAAARKFGDYNGNIYDLPGVHTFIEDGRSFVENTNQKFDVIYLSKVMTQASEGTGYALSENYIYTREAVRSYLRHLAPDGRLAFVLHSPVDLAKAVATVTAALRESGFSDEQISRQVLIAGTPMNHHGDGQLHNPLLLVKKVPFTKEEISGMAVYGIKAKIQPLYLPVNSRPADLFKFMKVGDTLAAAVTDNRPFFYNVGNTVPVELYVLLGFVVFLGWLWIKSPVPSNQRGRQFLWYFGALGMGFMLIENAMVQKFILILGHPTLAFSVVVATLLVGGGLGSLLGQTVFVRRTIVKRLWIPTVLVALLTLLTAVAIPWIFSSDGVIPLQNKTALAVLTLLPLSFAMGLPFPTGLRLLEENNNANFVPLAWGVNGWFSVIGSIVAMIIAITLGFQTVLFTGAIVYAGLAVARRALTQLTEV